MAKATAPASTALSVETVDEMPVGTRGRTRQETPFDGWLRESYESGKGKAVTVPSDKVKEVTSAIRAAAARQNLGVQVKPVEQGNGNVKVYFLGREKRAYNRNTLV